MPADLVIIGLGYVGLPLAQEAVRAGLSVVGFDVNQDVVDSLNSGLSHVDDLSNADIAAMLRARFHATTDETEIRDAMTAVMCVPTPLAPDGGPDLGPVTAATATIARNVQPGMLVVLESTTYPGTTEELLRPALELSGLTVGEDLFLAFSPERVDPGNPVYGIKNTPKVVGGCTPACTARAVEFYGRFIDTVLAARGTREAEMAKLLENTYRHVNIALVNEMSRFCHDLGIDFWDVIRLAKTKPFGFQAFYPGPGVGGHCIPIDPNYLSYDVRSRLGYAFRFVELAQEINASMPTYVARRAQDILNADRLPANGSSVLLLGVTYKPNIADLRESPAVGLAHALIELGVHVSFHDPFVEQWNVDGHPMSRVEDLAAALAMADLTILVQNHTAYDTDELVEASQRFFDTRGATTTPKAHRL